MYEFLTFVFFRVLKLVFYPLLEIGLIHLLVEGDHTSAARVRFEIQNIGRDVDIYT